MAPRARANISVAHDFEGMSERTARVTESVFTGKYPELCGSPLEIAQRSR